MRRLTLAAAAVALALAGCGGDGDDDDGTPGDTGAATTDVPLTGTIGGATTGDEDGETGTDDD